MRSSYRLALIATLALAGAAAAPGRDSFFAAARVEDPGAQAPRREPSQAAAEPDESPRGRFRRIAEGAGRRAATLEPSPAEDGAPLLGAGDTESDVEAAAGLHWIGIFEAPNQPLVSAGGIDFSAPRHLTLWKLDELRRQATPVTQLQSEVGRPFLAEHLLLSARGARLVVAPRGSDPFGPLASTIIEVPARDRSRRESP